MFGPGGSFFVGGMEGGMEARTDSLPAGRLHGRAWCGRLAGSYKASEAPVVQGAP